VTRDPLPQWTIPQALIAASIAVTALLIMCGMAAWLVVRLWG
jgi:hypothetical protein